MVDLEDLNRSEVDSEEEAEPVPAAKEPAAKDKSQKPARSKGGDSIIGRAPYLDEAPGEVARQIMVERQY